MYQGSSCGRADAGDGVVLQLLGGVEGVAVVHEVADGDLEGILANPPRPIGRGIHRSKSRVGIPSTEQASGCPDPGPVVVVVVAAVEERVGRAGQRGQERVIG